jgi:hypothetical protein
MRHAHTWLPQRARKRPREVSIGLSIALLALLAVLIAIASGPLFSCASLPSKQPATAWVEAERAVHDVLAPRFALYLEADAAAEFAGLAPVLPPLERDLVSGLLADWDFRIRSHESALPPAPVTSP